MEARVFVPSGGSPEIVLRPLSTPAEFAQCTQLQRDTWGRDFTEVVPPALLLISQKVGGVAAGAFDDSGRLVGFVYGVSGMREGRPAHWSHMLAVRAELEGRGVGRALKLYQRDILLANGIAVAYWTFDPLVARNAHLNLNRFGARIAAYVPNMYGDDTQSELHSGLGTDRLVAQWDLDDERVHRAIRGEPPLLPPGAADAPVVNVEEIGGVAAPVVTPFQDHGMVRVEIPADIQEVKEESPDVGVQWRSATRHAFRSYLDQGYRVIGFRRDRGTGRCFYALGRGDD